MNRHQRRRNEKNSSKRISRLVKTEIIDPVNARGCSILELVALADEKIAESKVLAKARHFNGAAYLSGYAVELLLKAIISDRRMGGRFPVYSVPEELKTHNFDLLIHFADMGKTLRAACGANPPLAKNWLRARRWNTDIRYARLKTVEARAIYDAITDVNNGAAPWFRQWARGPW